ncbi:MAG: hypothetical protein AB7U73_20670 [Pirellulales bacterium]
MSDLLTIAGRVELGRRRRSDASLQASSESAAWGRVPRVARLMALAIRFDELLAAGSVRNYAQLARLGHVTRARITQIMNLRALAPEIQEALLFMQRLQRGRDPIHLAQLQPIARQPLWSRQRELWQQLVVTTHSPQPQDR